MKTWENNGFRRFWLVAVHRERRRVWPQCPLRRVFARGVVWSQEDQYVARKKRRREETIKEDDDDEDFPYDASPNHDPPARVNISNFRVILHKAQVSKLKIKLTHIRPWQRTSNCAGLELTGDSKRADACSWHFLIIEHDSQYGVNPEGGLYMMQKLQKGITICSKK